MTATVPFAHPTSSAPGVDSMRPGLDVAAFAAERAVITRALAALVEFAAAAA